MTIDTNQFWNLLSESELINVQQVQTLFSEFSADTSLPKTTPALAKWMVKKKSLSPYQAKIILKGHSGPFRYGNYTIFDRLNKGPFENHFIGRHTKTSFPVLMQFFEGTETEHLKNWTTIETLNDKVIPIKHPNFVEIYESVVLNEHRFVVSQFPNGITLAEKLPRKARMTAKKACGLIAQAAYGLEQLHKVEIVHNAISPRTIWINKKSGRVQLRLNAFPDAKFESLQDDPKIETQFDYRAPECFNGSMERISDGTKASDMYSLGCTLFRAVAGRPPFPDLEFDELKSKHQNDLPPSLKKLDLPPDLLALIQQMLAKDPAGRPNSIGDVANLLALHSGHAQEIQSLKLSNSKTRKAYLNSLSQFLPTEERASVATPQIETEEAPIAHEEAAPDISLEDDSLDAQGSEERLSKIERAARAAELRRKNRWKMPAAIAACLLALCGIIGAGAYYADQTVVADNDDPATEKLDKNDIDKAVASDPIPDPNAIPPSVVQTLIDDDQETLWETPTTGPPIELSYLPATPKLMFVLRPKELVTQPEGKLILQSLGPEFNSKLVSLKNQSGLDLENMEQLIVSLHSNDAFEYEPYFIVQTETPIEPDRLIQLWNRPASKKLENGQDIYESSDGESAYYFLYNFENSATQSNPDEESSDQDEDPESKNEPASDQESKATGSSNTAVSRFAFGSKKLVEEVALSAGANLLSGSLRKLVDWTDRERHLNILFLTNSLFNDEGQKLMGERMGGFNRELRLLMPDDVRGGLVSLHLDSGNYFEIMLDKNFDLKAPELKTIMVDELRSRRDALMQFASNIPPNPYWDRVRIRYASMLTDLNKNLRWNVENGEVVANCWLPPMAAHNLLAASELMITFAGGSSAAPVAAYTGPKSIQELLALKRDLQVANPPDLNVLMANLKTEIEDDLGRMPFAFNIRLIGGDLEADGITKNQRPSELDMKQKSLAEILTSIMVGANPDKDISGPADPNCKLIWVVGDDPDNPGQKAILITTRSAAAKKSYELPPAFRTE